MDSAIKIEPGIPIPPPRIKRSKYPFAEMKVGDSFAISNIKERNSVLAGIVQFKLKTNQPDFKITVRQQENGNRVWRVA